MVHPRDSTHRQHDIPPTPQWRWLGEIAALQRALQSAPDAFPEAVIDLRRSTIASTRYRTARRRPDCSIGDRLRNHMRRTVSVDCSFLKKSASLTHLQELFLFQLLA
jgi:hypothetical protein